MYVQVLKYHYHTSGSMIIKVDLLLCSEDTTLQSTLITFPYKYLMQLPHALYTSVSIKCHAFCMISHIRPPHVISRSEEKFKDSVMSFKI